MSLLRHLFGISSKISNSSKYPKTPKMLIFRVFHIPPKIPLFWPLFWPWFWPLRNAPKIPLSKKHHFFWKSQKHHFSKNTIFLHFWENLIFRVFSFFAKKGIFCIFVIFVIFLIFEKMRKCWIFVFFGIFTKCPFL